jgi:hypothetical protein
MDTAGMRIGLLAATRVLNLSAGRARQQSYTPPPGVCSGTGIAAIHY